MDAGRCSCHQKIVKQLDFWLAEPIFQEWTDKIYEADPVKFKRLVVWVRAAARTYQPEIIATALRQFEAVAGEVSNAWWPYLDRILDKVEGDANASDAKAEHEARTKAEADYCRATFGGRKL